MSEPIKKSHPLVPVGGIVGAIGGWSLSQYCGAAFWIPAVAIFLFILLFTKTPIRTPFFLGAIVTTAAHVTWFIIGSAITGVWSATALDIVALTIGIVWLWVRPGLISVLFLGLVQGGALAVNTYTINSVAFGSPVHRALTAHCVLRLIAIAGLVVGYVWLRRERSTSPPVPTVEFDEHSTR